MRWTRRRGDRVTITSGKNTRHQGTVESNVYQRTVDYPGRVAQRVPCDAGHREAGYGAVEAGEGCAAEVEPDVINRLEYAESCRRRGDGRNLNGLSATMAVLFERLLACKLSGH